MNDLMIQDWPVVCQAMNTVDFGRFYQYPPDKRCAHWKNGKSGKMTGNFRFFCFLAPKDVL